MKMALYNLYNKHAHTIHMQTQKNKFIGFIVFVQTHGGLIRPELVLVLLLAWSS